MFNNINLNLYKDFYLICKYGSINKAAKESYTSPSAISKSIKKLESELNRQLFYRNSDGMMLTSYGEKLLFYVEESFNSLNVADALKLLSNYKNQVMKNKKIMDNYTKFHRNNIPVEIHYTLIKGVNDGNKELKCLINLLKEYNIPIKFIKFNETNTLKRSDNEEIWIKSLKEELPNLNIKSYSPPGRCVGSSCGEFTKHYYHYEIETKEEKENFLKWKKEYEI